MKQTIFNITSREDFIINKDLIDINERDSSGKNILYYALKKNDIEKVRWLLEEGLDLSKLNDYEEYMAFSKTKENEDLQNLLIYYGLSLKPSSDLYENNLNKAYESANVEILKMMIGAGNPLYICNDREDYSHILHHVKKDYKMWKYLTSLYYENNLFKTKINIDDQDMSRETLLFKVKTKEDILKLLELGADINSVNNKKESALFYADLEKSKYLIDSGINVNIKDESGMNALEIAVKNKDKEKVALLIYAGIDTRVSFIPDELYGSSVPLKDIIKKTNVEMYDFITALEENIKLNKHLKENMNKDEIDTVKKRL